MKKLFSVLIVCLSGTFLMGNDSGCYSDATDRAQRRQTENMVAEAHRQTGLPNIKNFTEKKFAKMIYEFRDQEVSTFSYFMDMNGNLRFLCESVGFGLPYSVQYVNPEKIVYRQGDNLPQPEPNGLFMPDGLSATWVLCSDKKGNVHPVYSEPSRIVSPFPLHSVQDLRGG